MEGNTAVSAMQYWSVPVDKVITILGPTAVGKTALSFSLAEAYGSELVSGDAYQIYRHMDIGTAKPTTAELQRYTHHLIDIADPDEAFSAARFRALAAAAISKINGAGKVPILVGGTGLYVQSLLEGYTFAGSESPEPARERARQLMERLTPEDMMQHITRATAWQPPDWHELLANTHRLTRLLCAIEMGDGPAFVRAGKADGLVYDAFVVGLRLPRDLLYERINERVDAMLQAGWIEEVQQLLQRGYSTDLQSMKAIGYEELALYVDGKLSLEEAASQIKQRTRRFAKRQLSWYKRMPYIHWFDKAEFDHEQSLANAVQHAIDIAWQR